MADKGPAFPEIETKLSAARTKLILEQPFLGALVMHLPLTPADCSWCETTATDARAFYYNPDYIAGLSLSQTQFILAHEALHCALGHFARRGHRLAKKWDVACDLATNMLLMKELLKPPPGALANERFDGLSAEEIYPLLEDNPQDETLDKHLFDEKSEGSGEGGGQKDAGDTHEPQGGGQAKREQPREPQSSMGEHAGEREGAQRGKPARLSEREREELEIRWQNRLASAAQQARMAGKLRESWLRLVDDLITPRLPWRSLLARYLVSGARDDFSFQRPSRREGAAIMPSLQSQRVNVVVALDTSGSIDEDEMREFVSEVDALKSQVNARVTLLACDERLDAGGPWTFEPWEMAFLPEGLQGGGGTDFRPVFDWVDHEQVNPDCLVYFTDAEGEFPEAAPRYPVIWLVKGKAKVPFGERIPLN